MLSEFEMMRIKLMMRDENEQISAAQELYSKLTQPGEQRKQFIRDLLQLNIVHALCDVMGTINEHLLTMVLRCLSVISTSKVFFENDLADLVLDKIMKTSIFLMKKRKKYGDVLYKMLVIVEEVLFSAKKHQIDLETVCDISRVLEFLDDFHAVKLLQGKPLKSSIRIFKEIIPHIGIPLENTKAGLIRRLFEDHLLGLQQIIESNRNPNSLIILNIIKYVCEINSKAAWFCLMIQDSYDSENYVEAPPKTLHDTLIVSLTSRTSSILIESVLPYFKKFARSKAQIIYEYFLRYLNQLYELQAIRTVELSRALAVDGYLTFLFEEGKTQTVEGMNFFPTSVSQLLSKILANLAVEEGSLGVDQTPGDISDFQVTVMQDLLLSMESNPTYSNGFLVLMYFHYKATKESIEIPPKTIITHIVEAPEADLHVAHVRVLWFFLAKLMPTESERPRELSEAVFKLFAAVKSLGVDKCFLDDVDAVKYVLGHPLGDQVRKDVLERWIQLHKDVEILYDDFTQDNLVFWIWRLIEAAPNNLIGDVQRCLESLIQQKNLEDRTRQHLLQRIPDILAGFSNSMSHNLISILELFEGVRGDFPLGSGVLCAPNIIRILLMEGIDPRVKHPIVKFSGRILRAAECQSDNRVARIFIGRTEFIREICTLAFDSQGEELLSGTSLKLLRILLVGQEKFKLKSEKIVDLEEIQLSGLLKRTQVVSLEAIRLLTILLSERIDRPILRVGGFTSEARRDQIIYRIYVWLITLHERFCSNQWGIIYGCLIEVLKLCQRRNFKKVLSNCCDCIAHFIFVCNATQSFDISPEFFNFLNHWLTTSISISTSNVQHALMRKENKSASIHPFGRTLELLNEYIRNLGDNSEVDRTLVNTLKDLVEKLV